MIISSIFFLLPFVSLIVSKDVCGGNDFGNPGDFDFYVFSQSWSATFCQSHPSYIGCISPTEFMRMNLTTHGLWSSFLKPRDSYSWPSCCQGDKYSISQQTINKYQTELDRFWPSEQGISPIESTLWYHEVQEHGSCTLLSESDFVSQVLSMSTTFSILQTPHIIQSNVGGSITFSQLQEVYQKFDTFLDCGDDGETLTEIRTCFSKDFQQINCPPIVMKESGFCSSDIVIIPAFESWTRQIR